jgi:hypothetical protein
MTTGQDARIGRDCRRRALRVYLTAGYAAAAAGLVYLARDRINPDAIAYIQNARHYAAGRLDLAVNGWFGPLMSWLLVPAAMLGGEPAIWMRICNACFGLVLAAGAARLARRLDGGRWELLIFAAGLLLSLYAVGNELTPDLLLAAALTWYFVAAHGLLRGGGAKKGFAVGAMGGLCYYIKGYALVFMVAHLAMTCALRVAMARKGLSRPGAAKALAAALAGVLLAAGPWVAVLTRQAGRLTISTLSGASEALSPVPTDRPLPIHRIQPVTPGRITNWESPREIPLPWGRWDARSGWDRLGKRARVVGVNARDGAWLLLRMDLAGLLFAGWVAGAALCFMPARRPATQAEAGKALAPSAADWDLRWACLTAGLYVAGLLPLWVVGRFFWPLWGVLPAVFACVLSIIRGGGLPAGGAANQPAAQPARWRARLANVAAAALIVSIAGEAFRYVFLDEWGTLNKGRQGTQLRRLARAANLRGAVVTNKAGEWSEDNWYYALFTTYWANVGDQARSQFLGEFIESEPSAVAEELRPFGPSTVLIFNNSALARKLSAQPGFRSVMSVHEGKGEGDIRANILRYVPR